MKIATKTPLTAALNWLARLVAYFQMRSLEIQIDGMSKALECIRCPMTAARIEIARHFARAELARARAAYTATLPVGVRCTWRLS